METAGFGEERSQRLAREKRGFDCPDLPAPPRKQIKKCLTQTG